MFTQFPCHRYVREKPFKDLLRRNVDGVGIVANVEDLETQAILFKAKVNDLPEIAGIDITEDVAPALGGVLEKIGKPVVFVRLDHIADTQSIDVEATAALECPGGFLVQHLGEAVTVHGIDIVVLLQWQHLGIDFAIGKADAVCGFGRREDYLADSQFHRRLDDVVSAERIDLESYVVGIDQNTRNSSKMNHRIEARYAGAGFQLVEIGVARHDVEHLPGVGDVGDQIVDTRQLERNKIDVDDAVTFVAQIWNDVATRLAGATGKKDSQSQKKPPWSKRYHPSRDGRACFHIVSTGQGGDAQITSRFRRIFLPRIKYTSVLRAVSNSVKDIGAGIRLHNRAGRIPASGIRRPSGASPRHLVFSPTMEVPMERRLSAIFAIDMVGYSRLMEADEVDTIERQKRHRKELIDPVFDKFHGRIVKEMGDGILLEFPSVVEAVQCATTIQSSMPEREAAIPEGNRIRYRIGINLGDILVEDGDIFGDGVNIAVRLEELAQPEGICISGTVFDHMRSTGEVAYEPLGEVRVKNIERPIRAYRVRTNSGRRSQSPSATPSATKPAIAVLPFDNMSGDPEQQYFADGITEDLIIMLGRCRWLMVIARNSVFSYKGQSPDIRRVSRELGVKYVLEGSVRRSGDRVRITAQLTNGKTGAGIFSERYDRQLTDMFELQEEIASAIAGTIEPELTEIEGRALRGRSTTDLDAWDSYQKGLWHLYRFKLDDLAAAKSLFEQAIELDKNFSQAYARLAYVYVQLAWYGSRPDRPERVNAALAHATRAVELDGKDPSARLSLGRALVLSGSFEEGVQQLRNATALDPSFAQAHFALGQALTSLDRYQEAIEEIDLAMQLSPRDPHLWTFYHVRAIANYIGDRLEQAETDEHAALREPNVTFYPYTILTAILGRQGKTAESAEVFRKLRKLKPGISLADILDEWHFGEHPIMTPRFMERFENDFRKGMVPV